MKKDNKSVKMEHMKKILVFLLCAVLLMAAVRVGMFRYQDRPEDFAAIEEWIDLGKEKAEQIKGDLSEKIAQKGWEIEGAYDIESDKWFENEGNLYSGSLGYTKLNEGVVNHFDLQAAGCKIVIAETDEEDFYFSFQNMKKVQVSQDAGVLHVKVVRETLIEEDTEENILNLYFPREYVLESAEIELGAGSIEAEKLHVYDLNITVEAGKMAIDTLISDKADLSVGAGMLTIGNGELKNADLSVDVGNMIFNGNIQGNADIECAVGNMQMILQGDVKDFNYELQCMAGNILLNGEKHSGVNEGMSIDNAASKQMDLDCAMGNMKIEFVK